MKKIIYKLFVLTLIAVSFSSCEEREEPIFDVRNGRSIAGFGAGLSSSTVSFNPDAEVQESITIGVSTLSDADRTVQLSLDAENTTLDAAYYSINTLSPVIPAGEFTTTIIVTIIPSGEEGVYPQNDEKVTIKLESVEDAEILDDSIDEFAVILDDVPSPVCTFDPDVFTGSFTVVQDDWEDYAPGDTVQVEGMIDGGNAIIHILSTNNAYIDNPGTSYMILTVDTETGEVVVTSNEDFQYTGWMGVPITGEGIVNTCNGKIELTLNFSETYTGNVFILTKN